MIKNLFILIIIGLLVLAASLALFFSNESKKAQKESTATIDSLIQICSGHAEQVNNLKTEIASLNKEIQGLKFKKDSLEDRCKLQTKDKRQLTGQIRRIKKKINECEEKTGDNEENERNFLIEIEELKRVIELLHSRHDIPIIFLLYSSLQYYSSDSLKDQFFSKELDRIAQINGWQVSCEQIVSRISKSSKFKYRGLKWAGLKAGCPFEATYFLLKEYNYNPENIDEEEFVELLKEVFHSLKRDFTYCSDHIRKSFYSEPEALKRIKDTIVCLKQNLEIK